MLSAVVRRAAWLGLGLAALTSGAPGCYTGSAHDVSARRFAELSAAPSSKGWQLARDVPFVPQRSDRDCGPAAMTMVLRHFGVDTTLEDVTSLCPVEGGGVRAGDLRAVARRAGLDAFVVPGTFADIIQQIGRGRPVLVGLVKPMSGDRGAAHYEVVVGINRAERSILTLDPARGLRENSLEGFAREWVAARQVTIIVLPRAAHPRAGSAVALP